MTARSGSVQPGHPAPGVPVRANATHRDSRSSHIIENQMLNGEAIRLDSARRMAAR
ncbi:hypothetical protein MMAN_42060 [Mycobacterium mantenii]|uniref:Uncharacterized protein n=1 Tax=Mycobacterium mantenii TaxID=560555 RepID=A0ABM7JWW0_MYCNT|nr:hypothetical protein MMAN_42060 [Mycobacterium mantenii]